VGGGLATGTRSGAGQDVGFYYRGGGGGRGRVNGISCIWVLRRLGAAFRRARIKSRDFRGGYSKGSSFMIPSHSFSTSVSLQTEMPKQILVVKKEIWSNNTYKRQDKVKKTTTSYTHRNALRLHKHEYH